ncbi:MAG TPA: hypothetical protein PLE69_04495 [bacterium]|nr:hypothetical protein [bacterium]
MNKNIILSVFFFTGIFVGIAGEKLQVDFSYPSLKGDFYVNGKASFPPGIVNSEENISIQDKQTGEEVPTKIIVVERWPDGSLLEAEILFPANAKRQRNYIAVCGSDIKRRKKFTQTAVLPIISASIGKTPQTTESIDMAVGELLVKVDKSPDIRYYWYALPMGILLFLTVYRAVRNVKG